MNPWNEFLEIYSQSIIYLQVYDILNIAFSGILLILLFLKKAPCVVVSFIYSVFRLGQLFCQFALLYLFGDFSILVNDRMFLFKFSLFVSIVLFLTCLWKILSFLWTYFKGSHSSGTN